jgi:ribosome-binding protein aMBF1 (putative translation factor)
MKSKQINQFSPTRFKTNRAGFFVGNIQHSVAKKFGSALKNRRISLGMTQLELSQKSGINRSYISDVERGKESISLDRADILSRCVQSTLSELLKE